uniref:Secreted protein n=1 Tax=Panagrellus redivivus TaxID=6233 RepID=A0A7E4UTC1_PANRE
MFLQLTILLIGSLLSLGGADVKPSVAPVGTTSTAPAAEDSKIFGVASELFSSFFTGLFNVVKTISHVLMDKNVVNSTIAPSIAPVSPSTVAH